MKLKAYDFGTSTIMVTMPFDRNGFTEVVPVKKTDEEKIVKALKLNSHLAMNDMTIIIGKTRKTVMRFLKKNEKIIRVDSDKADHREIKKQILPLVIMHREKRINVGGKGWKH